MEPERGWLPDQPPLAAHEVALFAAQLSVDAEPLVTVLGLALKLTVVLGAEVTVTVADCVALPPAPLQVSENTEVAVSAPVDWVPLTALVPPQAPDAAQELALVELQLRVAEPPLVMALGPTLRVTVGVGAVTVTVTDWDAVPPAPEQVKV